MRGSGLIREVAGYLAAYHAELRLLSTPKVRGNIYQGQSGQRPVARRETRFTSAGAVSRIACDVVRGTQWLKVLAVFLVLGRMVSLRLHHDGTPPTQVQVIPEKADRQERPEPEKRGTGWVSNVLITGVIICMISVALSGVVSLLVSDHNSRGQSQDTAREAASNQQTQEVGQLQKSANAIDQDAQNVAIYAFRCSVKGKKWAACVFGAPAYFKLLADSDTLGAIADSTTDQRADVLARKLSGKVNALLASKTVLAGITDLGATTDAQLDLDQRCGLLIQGFS